MTSFRVSANRLDHHLATVSNQTAEVSLGVDLAGNQDALNPMELLMGALSACMIKGINRLTPLLGLQIDGVTMEITATRRDTPPGVESMHYRIVVDSPDSDEKLALLHENLQKFGTVSNTIAQGTALTGELVRSAGH
jgi:uncharacterized OsmC-like protein